MTRRSPSTAKAAAPEAAAYFAGPRRLIRVTGAATLLASVRRLLPDWASAPPAAAPPDGAGAASPDIRVERRADGVRISEGDPAGAVTDYADIDEAINGLVGALIAAYVGQEPNLVSLHAAASLLDGRLVVMIGDAEAGKSSLAAHLVRLGFRSFGDDRLVLRLATTAEDEGLCLALPHKLRLPLPADAGAGFAAFVEARTAWRAPHVAQLRLQKTEAARFEEAAPIAALLLLARGAAARASLEPVPPSLVVRELLRQGFAPQLSAEMLLRAFIGLAGRVPAHRLCYARSADAAHLLAERFAGAARRSASEAGQAAKR